MTTFAMPATAALKTETFLPAAVINDALLSNPGDLPAPAETNANEDAETLRARKLLKKLRRGVHLADTMLDTSYMTAFVVVSLWGLLLAAGAAFTGHWGLCTTQAGVSGATLYIVKRRKESFERAIENAKDIVGHRFLHMDLFDIISEVLQSFAGQGLDTALTCAAAAVAPIALAVPTMVLHFIPVKTWWVTAAVGGAIAALLAAVGGVGYAIYGQVREIVLERVDLVVDIIDDMPMFDFLDSDSDDDDDERTPLLV